MLPPRRHLKYLGFVVAAVAAVVIPFLLLTGPPGTYRDGALEDNLISFLRTRHGLVVDRNDMVLPDPPDQRSGLHPVEVYFLARKEKCGPDGAGGGCKKEKQRDLFFSHFILSSKKIPVHASPLFPLTHTSMADECELRLDATKRHLAYASRSQGKISVITLLDLAGLKDGRDLRGFSSRERLQQHLTSWQESGVWRGVGTIKVQLTMPQKRVKLAWNDKGLLEIRSPRGTWKAVLDPEKAKVLQGPARAARVSVPRRNFISWAVDTVRNFSFVGAERIAWLEHLVFGVVDKARRMSGSQVSLADIKDEMDLPVIRRKTVKISGWPPPRLRPILPNPMKGEGRWVEVEGPFLRTDPARPSYLAATFVRPDRERLFSRLYLIAWDPRRLDMRMVAGLRNPTSATGLRGPGIIPRDPKLLKRLVAAFNGGFQSTHGDFGMMVDRKVYAAARPYAATVARLADGSTAFGTWDGELPYGKHPAWISSFRQNLTPMVEDGKYNPWKRGSWGGGTGYFTGKGAKAHTWRSGLCLHKSGFVMYVLGNPIDGPGLGKAMTKVGCDYGMELDINVTHVGLEYLHVLGPDEKDPPGAERFRTQRYFSKKGDWPGVKGFRYFMRVAIRGTGNMPFPRWTGRADEREFFYLLKRELLPGADLKPMGQRPREGRWTSATLPAQALAFPQAMSRAFLHPDPANPERRVHLVQLDLRWLDTSLCVPGAAADCLSRTAAAKAGERPVAVLPLGRFSGSRTLLADGKSLDDGGQGGAGRYLTIRPLREEGAALPAVSARPDKAKGSISIQSNPAPARAGSAFTSALCTRDGRTLLYGTGIGVQREHLEAALSHAGCKREHVIHLADAAPLVLVKERDLATVYGAIVPPVAENPSLILRRSKIAWASRIFTHVEPQPRRVWTVFQPEWNRNSVRRRSNRIAKALGLPPIKHVNDLCKTPYSDYKEFRKLRWRDPITGEMCGKGYNPKIKIADSYKKLIKAGKAKRRRRRAKGKKRRRAKPQ
jgi:hypothetical protein